MLYKLIFIAIILFVNTLTYAMQMKAYSLENGIILYTNIPYYLEDDKRILKIVANGKKKTRIFFIIETILMIILAIFYDSISAMILDTLIVMLLYPFIFQKDIDEMRKFKMDNVKNKKRTKLIDFDLIEEKDRFVVKKSYYLIAIAIYIISIAIGVFSNNDYPKLMWIFLGLLLMLSNLFVDKILMKGAIVTYTDDSKKNILLNEKIAKKQARVLYGKILIDSILFLLLVVTNIFYLFSIMGFVIYILGIIFVISFTYYKYYKLRNSPILDNIDRTNLDNDVEYYNAWGYDNPDDNRLVVKRYYGVGSDINIGRTSGKIYYGVTIIILVVLMIFTSYIAKTPMKYDYNLENGAITIRSNQFYKDTVDVDDINEVNLLDKFPEGKVIRTGGNEFEKTSTGNYSIQNYGKVRLYIYKDTDKVIELKTNGKTILFNDNSNEKTKLLYDKVYQFVNENN